jgi:signal transduction histidine kinase
MTFGHLRIRNRISTQIAAVIVVALVLLHIALGVVFLVGRDERPPPPGEVVTLIRLIAATPAAERADLLVRLVDAFPSHELALASPVVTAEWSQPPHGFLHLPAGYASAIRDAAGDGRLRLAVRVPDGEVVTALLAPPPPPLFGPFSITLVSVAVLVTLLGLWAVRALARPLRAFAQAAEGFDPDGDIAPLVETGPEEVRAAAVALNGMRGRIKALVEDRTRLLAAVGHDLRTPITRLRLRCDFLDDESLRTAMLRDLAQMQRMAESVLDHLRAGRAAPAPVSIDLASLVQTVCDDFADLGHDVAYEGPDHAAIPGDAEALYRALANLVDNAVRYGGGAAARLACSAESVTVDIVDPGCGIPDALKAEMLKPFVRGDLARDMNDTAGFGLGLSISRAVAAAHGGHLALIDNQPQGLVARITLPRARGGGLSPGDTPA